MNPLQKLIISAAFLILAMAFTLEGNHTNQMSCTTSFYSTGDTSKIPNWLSNSFKREYDLGYGSTMYSEPLHFEHINDSLCIFIFNLNDGVCLSTYLKSFIGQVAADSIQIFRECNMDLTSPSYEWTDWNRLSTTTFSITTYKISAPDSMINEMGYLKDGEYLGAIETQLDSNIKIYDLLNSGKLSLQMN